MSAVFSILEIDYKSPSASLEFAKSLHETGFAVLKNHSISNEILQRALTEWKDFFSRPEKEKEKYRYNGKTMVGHYPYGSENAKGTELKNQMEYYHYNIKVDAPSFITQATTTLYSHLYEMGQTLMGWLDNHLPVSHSSQGSLKNMISELVPITLMRILHYPAPVIPPAHPTLLNVDHEDIGLMTLLCNATQPGLQVKDKLGQWHDVCYDDKSIVFNAGDMLQAATNGYFRSTTHRVIRPAHALEPRYSIPLFIGAKEDVYLTPTLKAGDYFIERMKENGVYKG